MKRKIIALTLALFIFAGVAGCAPSNGTDDTSATDTQKPNSGSVSDTSESGQSSNDDIEYFGFSEADGGYSYVLYNTDGSVAEEVEYCEHKPSHELLENGVSKVIIGDEVYYYDRQSRMFSETFTDVFDENGSLIVMAKEGGVIVCDAFDTDGFYKEIDNFTYPLSTTSESPFVSVSFSDDGGSVKCVYLSGGEEERTECFNITDGTKFVSVSDWINKKDLLSGEEKDRVKGFLYSYMGTVDYNTGCQYDYEISGALMINGERYYHCKCYYLMESDDGSVERVPAAEFVLSESMTERYDCRDSGGELVVYTEKNMI